MNCQLKNFSSPTELAQAAASDFSARIEQARQISAPFLVALSGGRITKEFFRCTVESVRQRQLPIDHVHFFWADERCVGPDHPDSNFALANEHLFQPLSVKAENIHRLKGELPANEAVAQANNELRTLLASKPDRPVLDLVLLGMGEDGHVASLFPNATPETLGCSDPFLAINNSPKPPPERLSLSFAAIQAATKVWVLASGSGKQTALADSLAPGEPRTPLGRVIQLRPETIIYTDIRD